MVDAFYTNRELAESFLTDLIQAVPSESIFIEPSAGSGAFIDPLITRKKKFIAMDIAPFHKAVRKLDFFSFDYLHLPEKGNIVVVGNPPFGRVSSSAVKFFNRAAKFSNTIAFILPKTFRKYSLQNRLDPHFHLVKDIDVPKNSFTKDGMLYNVPCCWQIWKKKKILRNKILAPDISNLLEFTTPNNCDFAMRRVGGRSGEILSGLNHSKSSTYFINERKDGVRESLERINWKLLRENTVGVRSISKLEIAIELNRIYGNEIAPYNNN